MTRVETIENVLRQRALTNQGITARAAAAMTGIDINHTRVILCRLVNDGIAETTPGANEPGKYKVYRLADTRKLERSTPRPGDSLPPEPTASRPGAAARMEAMMRAVQPEPAPGPDTELEAARQIMRDRKAQQTAEFFAEPAEPEVYVQTPEAVAIVDGFRENHPVLKHAKLTHEQALLVMLRFAADHLK